MRTQANKSRERKNLSEEKKERRRRKGKGVCPTTVKSIGE